MATNEDATFRAVVILISICAIWTTVSIAANHALLTESRLVDLELSNLEQLVCRHALQLFLQTFAPLIRVLPSNVLRQDCILPVEALLVRILALVHGHESLEHSVTFDVQDALHRVHQLEVHVLVE